MKFLWAIILGVIFLPLNAQRMRIEDFARYKKPFLRKATFTTDKHNALLDLYTNEKEFQFFVGEVAVPVAEAEGFVTLTLPNHTAFLTIKHPTYGQIAWKVPNKELKKRKHYHAYLHTESLDKEFQQEYLSLHSRRTSAAVSPYRATQLPHRVPVLHTAQRHDRRYGRFPSPKAVYLGALLRLPHGRNRQTGCPDPAGRRAARLRTYRNGTADARMLPPDRQTGQPTLI